MTYITIIYDFNLQLIIYVTSMRFLFLLLTSCFYFLLLLPASTSFSRVYGHGMQIFMVELVAVRYLAKAAYH